MIINSEFIRIAWCFFRCTANLGLFTTTGVLEDTINLEATGQKISVVDLQCIHLSIEKVVC